VNSTFAVVIMMPTLMVSSAFATDAETLFNDNCAVCHQRGGVGSPGLAPPLVDKGLWDKLGAEAPAYIAGVMLAGLSGPIEVAGQQYSGLVMPPQDRMNDDELAAIGTYVLSKLNNSGERLVATSLAEVRSAPPTHARLREMRRKGM
jgi:mono/diheme cytochrome c family protein